MKTINKLFIALMVTAGFSSCSDYLDINDSPTDPTKESVAPDLLLAGALTDNVGDPGDPFDGSIFISGNELGNVYMNNWAGDVQNYSSPFLNEYQLVLTTTFRDEIWDETYRDLATFQAIIDHPSEDYSNHKAIAQIMKVFYFQYLVDIYGDLPYFNALQGGDNITPEYDDAQEIYRDFIVKLDQAIVEINSVDDADVAVGAQDVVFQGNMSKWIQFANTLKLRILLRQSILAENDGATQSYLNEQFAKLKNNFLTTSATVNPGYFNGTGKQNPFYSTYGFDSEGTSTTNYLYITPTSYAAKFLKGEETLSGVNTGVLDPRVNRIYNPLVDAGVVVGVQQGVTSGQAPPVISELGPGIIVSAEQDMYLITAAESYFLQAEAVFRGYLTGDAKNLFQKGITASFIRLGLTQADAQTYINASNSVNLIGWDGSNNKIEAIMTQKWIALNSIHGLEIWIEHTRTGFPETPLSVIATESSLPNRLFYPASETSTNSSNLPDQGPKAPFLSKIFWDAN